MLKEGGTLTGAEEAGDFFAGVEGLVQRLVAFAILPLVLAVVPEDIGRGSGKKIQLGGGGDVKGLGSGGDINGG